jgi:NAD(P)-dependent dehydrogenase (short-subunit alcohol dehydrogenase family)
LFAKEGASVVIADVLDQEGLALANEIEKGGRRALFTRLDVTSEESWKAAIRAARTTFGEVDVLVNNAGISGAVPDIYDLAYFDKLWSINARGTFLGMTMLRETLATSGRGVIVNVSSILGIVANVNNHMGYSGSKAAIRLMSKSAAAQFARDGIRVNSLHPGWLSPMRTSVSSADPTERKRLIDAVPLQRSGTEEEAAYAALFLASSESSYVTGTELIMDGGLSAL